MNDEIHRHLDGEIPAAALAAGDREVAGDWDRMLESFRHAAPAGSAPAWLEQSVMAEISTLPEPNLLRRLGGWLLNPAPVRISPLAGGLVAAGLAALVLLTRPDGPTPDLEPTAGVAPVEVIYVQFLLEAPGATTVAVAGDFTGWEPSFTLDDADGDGLWSGRLPVRPGVHGYMFLIDGTDWQTDPNASRYQDDGFGNRNAVLAVGTSG